MTRRPTSSKNQISMHENDFWIPTLDYDGQVVYIIGGGPSVNDCDIGELDSKNVIAINSSAYKVFEAKITNPLLYFTDSGWWRNNEEIASNWPGKVVTLSKVAKRELPEKILRVEQAQPSIGFPPLGTGLVRWGRSSGHTAISLAVAMGASIIVLVGYDMALIDGKSHHHSDYPNIAHPGVYQEFIDHFNYWNRSAKLIGVNIFNTSMNSPLNEFEKMSYSQALLLSYTSDIIPSDISSIETSKYTEEEIISSEPIDVILNEPDPIQSTKIMGHSNLPIAPHRLGSWLRRK